MNCYSAMLLEEFGDVLPLQAHGYLDRISSSSSRMGALIDHLLEWSRIARAEIKLETVELSELANSTLSMLQETEPGRRVEQQVEQGVTVLGDESLLRQLLENLLGNAWKYTSKRQTARIQFGRALVAGQEAYFVKDDGVGFDQAYQERLFKAFERLHGVEFEGIGIGLASAERIVQCHGGAIWAEGEVDQGATFYFTLPAFP